MIGIINYGAGNLRSIQRALDASGAETLISADPAEIAACDAVVLPGVGNAGHTMRRLEEIGMADAIHETVDAGKPFLGICVGMQVLFDHQEEGDANGLGLMPGRVRSLKSGLKIPHMGWSQSVVRDARIGTPGDAPYYYFVHSYVAEPSDPNDIAATAAYGEEFPSVVIRDNVWGTQFHPEKSGTDGLAFVQAFVAEVNRRTGAAS